MRIRRAAAAASFLSLLGCAAVSTGDGRRLALTSPEFRTYVEQVFREQNRVADELGFALEEPAARSAELERAETRLLEACAGVNELATARRDDQSLGVRRSLGAARSVPECERATEAAAAALAAQDANRP